MQVTDAVATTAGRSIGLAVIEGLEEDLAKTRTILRKAGHGFIRSVQTSRWGARLDLCEWGRGGEGGFVT